jgi:hypothetical protein
MSDLRKFLHQILPVITSDIRLQRGDIAKRSHCGVMEASLRKIGILSKQRGRICEDSHRTPVSLARAIAGDGRRSSGTTQSRLPR